LKQKVHGRGVKIGEKRKKRKIEANSTSTRGVQDSFKEPAQEAEKPLTIHRKASQGPTRGIELRGPQEFGEEKKREGIGGITNPRRTTPERE